jgi:hypothetical protein
MVAGEPSLEIQACGAESRRVNALQEAAVLELK